MILRSLVLLCLTAACALAAPVSVRELQFLLRQNTPAAEIIQTVSERRLLAPIDAATEQALRASGASDALIATLKRPEMVLPPSESQAERQRRLEQEAGFSRMAQEDAALLARKKQQEQQIASYLSRAGATRAMLDGKLVRLDGDQVKPYDHAQLDGVRVFAFYYSAISSAPCRKFTPQLVEAYKRLKEAYPGQFELVFVSADRDEFNMHEYMRAHRMPWPAVQFGAATDAIRQFGGDGLPWLVAVSDTAVPLTRNGVDKKYIQPELVLEGIAQILGQLKR